MHASRKKLTLAACAVILVASIALTIGVFQLRSGSGDLYAPYSTFRADPLGTMAFYNGLDDLEGLATSRYMRPFNELPSGQGTTLFIPGASMSPDPVEALEAVEAFAYQGGRVIIAFRPVDDSAYLDALKDMLEERDKQEADAENMFKDDQAEDEEETGQESATQRDEDDAPELSAPDDEAMAEEIGEESLEEGKPETPEDADSDHKKALDHKILDVSERWPFAYAFEDAGDGFLSVPADAALSPEARVTWLSGLYFEDLDDRWKPVYIRPGGTAEAPWVTVMERKMGSGVIVLCSDTFFLSNEALRDHRATPFLQWLLGNRTKVLFSEVHLGTEQKDRVMTLVRRYRLHGLFFGLVLLALLFVWKNATTLVPRIERSAARAGQPANAMERSHQEGLDNLLARFVPAEQLLDTCLDVWFQQFHNSPRAPALREMRTALAAENMSGVISKDQVVAAYNRLAGELHKH